MDYKGADDVQDAFSIVSVHDPNPKGVKWRHELPSLAHDLARLLYIVGHRINEPKK